METMQENRQNMRVRLKGVVADLSFTKSGQTIKNVKDMSLSGIYVEDLSGIEINDQCQVNLTGWKKNTINFLSNVARVDNEGVGLQFVDIGYDTCELLRTLMLYKAEDPVQAAQLFQESCS